MDSTGQGLSLREAASLFLADLPSETRGTSQPEINRFVRWFGGERLFGELAAAEIANYAERLSLSAADCAARLEIARAFLSYGKKKGWLKTGLATHLRTKKGKPAPGATSRHSPAEVIQLTREGYASLEAELTELRKKRLEVIGEVRRAAADRDFRENAPLAAAREQKGHIEGRIMELEAALKAAMILDERREASLQAGVGDSVVLQDMGSGSEVCYRLVSPREVNPAKGRISSASPLGQAMAGKGKGAVVAITVPAGKLRYRIKDIRRD